MQVGMRAAMRLDRMENPMSAPQTQSSSFQTWDNPMGTDGFEFVEYAAPDPVAMGQLFERMGFTAIAKHRRKNVTLYRQGEINFIINAEPDSFAQRFARLHGPSVCAIAFRVHDTKAAYERALGLGAWGYAGVAGPGELNIPAIKGVGDSLIYLVDRWRGKNGAQPGDIGNIGFFDVDFEPLPGVSADEALNPVGHGLTYIDHLTHNVHRGRMNEWADFYERVFNFREIKYFDIEGQVTGVKSKAMTSPCGKIRIPINEEGNDQKGQIQEYLDSYRGEGVQHIAMATKNLYETVDALQMAGVKLLDTSDSYYELLPKRIPELKEPISELQARNTALAHRWINYMLEATPGAVLVSRQGLSNTTSESPFLRSQDRLIWLEQVEDVVRRTQLWERVMSGDRASKVLAP